MLRLTTSNQTSNGQTAQRHFDYDRWGNRTTVWDATSGGAQIQNLTLEMSGGVPTNRISSVGSGKTTLNYSYDAAGNVTNDGSHSYTYDGENRLVALDTTAAQYGYDQQNRRVKKTAGGVTVQYIWQGAAAIAEYNGTSGALLSEYIYSSSRLLAKIESGVTTYFLNDRLSMRLILDGSGNVTGQQAHLPFGEEFAESGAQQKQHFTSYERESESGLDYAINRRHQPATGRFMQADPYQASGGVAEPQSWNRYAYSGNDPVNFTDPSGLKRMYFVLNFWMADPSYNAYGYMDVPDGNSSPEDGMGSGTVGIKAPLEGDKLKKYNKERTKTQGKLKNSQKCREFLSSHGIDPDQALDAVNQQRAYDGEMSTIGAYSAGLYYSPDIDWNNPRSVRAADAQIRDLFRSNPGRRAVTAIYPGGILGVTLDSRSDVYFRGSRISASTILHEALHSLLGATDAQLAQQLGGVTWPEW